MSHKLDIGLYAVMLVLFSRGPSSDAAWQSEEDGNMLLKASRDYVKETWRELGMTRFDGKSSVSVYILCGRQTLRTSKVMAYNQVGAIGDHDV
ncbi:hypothetical protein BDZ97DRAFT_1848533 [Flammula alnicola]|nr:hypothetical protein BDZ97DRAFT_1848533 [Flammula alnicola]